MRSGEEMSVEDPSATSSVSDVLPDELVREELRRLLNDADFNASDSRRLLLTFVVEETIAGRADRLKGTLLAQEVFGRDAEFDPQIDPIVRIEALRLRRDLDTYYAEHGDRTPVRFAIPKGAYTATFTRVKTKVVRPSGQIPPALEMQRAVSSQRKLNRATVIGAAALMIGFTGFAAHFLPSTWAGKSSIASAMEEPGLAIANFTPLSLSEDDRYLAMGISDQLLHDLMNYDGFRVFALPEGRTDLSTEARLSLSETRNIDYLLTGKMRGGGNEEPIRLLVQLHRSSGEVVWSADFSRQRTAGSLMDMQDELALSIAAVLGQTYGIVANDVRGQAVTDVPPSDSTYSCLLQAHAYRREIVSAAIRAPALSCLEAAVRRDPQAADAWAMLGWLRRDVGLFEQMPEEQRQEQFASALEASERAVSLAPQNPLALQAHSGVLYYLGRFDEAAEVIRNAWMMRPEDPELLHQMGWRMAARSDFQEGVEYVREALARSIDPPNRYYNVLAIEALMQGDYDAMLDHAKISSVSDYQMGNLLLAIANARSVNGNPAVAKRALAEAAERQPGFFADPAATLLRHGLTDRVVDEVIYGLRDAGWHPPNTQ